MSNFLFQEEEERKRKEEQEHKEHEEYLLLKEQFTVEEEGVGETAEEVRFCHVIYYLQLKKIRVYNSHVLFTTTEHSQFYCEINKAVIT